MQARSTRWLWAVVVVSGSAAGAASAGPIPTLSLLDAGNIQESCEECHYRERDAAMKFPDGTSRSAWVDLEQVGVSVHAGELNCLDCHRGMGPLPHAELRFETQREYRVARSGACNRCHYALATELADSMHRVGAEKGDLKSPTCVDCHGAHEVSNPRLPRQSISDRCAKCHEEIAKVYQASVHGLSLAKGDEHAPVCTDCHGAHQIFDPKTPDAHAASYMLCARCHSDEKVAKEHKLSATVVRTYLDDFHGASNHLYVETKKAPSEPVATCSDCHGFHDVRSFADDREPALMQARVSEMCRRCHKEAPDGFEAAWLSHNPPSFTDSPAVAGVTWVYRIMIPIMLLGLVMHILLDLVRVRVPRHEEK